MCFPNRRPPIHVFSQPTFIEHTLWSRDFCREWLYENEGDTYGHQNLMLPWEKATWKAINDHRHVQYLVALWCTWENTWCGAVSSAPLGSAKASPENRAGTLKRCFEFSLMEGRTMYIPGRITDVRNRVWFSGSNCDSWTSTSITREFVRNVKLGTAPETLRTGPGNLYLNKPWAEFLHSQLWEPLLNSADGIKGRRKCIS